MASEWPKREDLAVNSPPEEEREIALVTASQPEEPVIPFSTFKRFAAWILRFVHNCRTDRESATLRGTLTLTVVELAAAERYCITTRSLLGSTPTPTKEWLFDVPEPVSRLRGSAACWWSRVPFQLKAASHHPSWKAPTHKVDYSVRALVYAACGTHSAVLLTQPSLPHCLST